MTLKRVDFFFFQKKGEDEECVRGVKRREEKKNTIVDLDENRGNELDSRRKLYRLMGMKHYEKKKLIRRVYGV